MRKKIIGDIIDFWEEEMPYVIGPVRRCKFYRRAAISCVEDFLDNNEQDIKHYPWDDKIFEKRKELFGF